MEIELNGKNFEEEVLGAEKPVLVDFWASWCGPCKMLAPVLEEIAREREDIIVGKVNVDEEPKLAMQYKVSAIPTLMVFRDGDCVNTSVGYLSKEEILALL